MTKDNFIRPAVVLAWVGLFSTLALVGADNAAQVELSDKQAFPESITASSDGALYVSSVASGGITRIPRGATRDEPWLKPGAFDSRSTFGVFVDTAAQMLWVC